MAFGDAAAAASEGVDEVGDDAAAAGGEAELEPPPEADTAVAIPTTHTQRSTPCVCGIVVVVISSLKLPASMSLRHGGCEHVCVCFKCVR